MIYFDRVSKRYPEKNVSLKNITFSVSRGEFASIIGPSGAGKTSIFKILLGEEKPTEGEVHFESINIHKLRKSDIPKYRQKIGVIFQDYKLLKNKTAFENIAFAMESVGRSDEEISSDVAHVLELVGLADYGFRFPHQMSGGEQQRLAIARAIINQPDIIIADEPTAALDPKNREGVIHILKKINELGTTVLLATHDKDTIKSLKTRIIKLEDGKIIEDKK